MRIGKVLLLAMTLTLGVSTAFAQSIDLCFNAAGTICEGNPAGNAFLYILARPGGAVADGITTAEFFVDGLPGDWFTVSTPNALAAGSTIGDPFASVSPFRTTIGFPSCQAPNADGVVLLFSVRFFPGTPVSDHYLTVVVGNPPSNPNYTTPILVACDYPTYTAYPVSGGQFILGPNQRHCTVGVESTTWSSVKGLYSR
jgi:hypothetical protein